VRLLVRRRIMLGRCDAVLLGRVLVRFSAAVTRTDCRLLVDGGGGPMGLAGVSVPGGGGTICGFGTFQRLLGT
jgi:hypothetical protein